MIDVSAELAKRSPRTVLLPTDPDGAVSYVILVWAFRRDLPHELIAVATSDDARKQYEENGKIMYPDAVIQSEITPVDHAYGRGMLQQLNKFRARSRGTE